MIASIYDRLSTRIVGPLALSLAAVTLGGGCDSRLDAQQAEVVFAEAEALRREYEREAGLAAIEKYQAAFDAWNASGDLAKAARAGERLGAMHEQLGALDAALQAYAAAVSPAEQSSDRLLESEIRSAIGMVGALAGEDDASWARAEAQCDAALALAQAWDGEAEHGKALNCRGEVAYARGDRNAAIAAYREAGAHWRASGDREGIAATFLYLGYSYSDLSLFDDAATSFEAALPLWQALGDTRGEAETLVAIARMQRRRGEYQPALARFYDARRLFEQMGDAVSTAGIVDAMAAAYFDMARYGDALRHWQEALGLFEAAGLDNYTPSILWALGETNIAMGNPADAIPFLDRALRMTEESGNERHRAYSLRFLGLAYQSLGDADKALDHLQRALEIEQSAEDPRLEARALNDIGEAYRTLGDPDAAIGYFERAVLLARASNDRIGEARQLFGLARARSELGDVDDALEHLQDALDVAESLRAEVVSQELRASYLASVHSYYLLRVDLLMQLDGRQPRAGFDAAAFEASEQAKARSLMESLATAGVDLTDGVAPELLAEEHRVRTELDERYRRQVELLGDADEATNAALAAEIRELEAQYEQARSEIRAHSPRYATLSRPQPLSLERVQREVLDANTLLLEYSLGEERSFLWAVSREAYASYELAPRAQIEAAAQEVYELLTARLDVSEPREYQQRVREADARYGEAASRLSELLLGPVADSLADKRLVLVTDGLLQYVPFGALPAPGGGVETPVPLIVQHEIVSLPSASVLAVLREQAALRPRPRRAVAVLADPVFEADDPRLRNRSSATTEDGREAPRADDSELGRTLRNVGFLRDGGELYIPRLATTGNEANRIIAQAPPGSSWKAVDFAASRATATSGDLSAYRIVHFATHGVFNNGEPGLSGLILSMFDEAGRPQDGFLRLHDIYRLDLPAELVVLSACNTALGQDVAGEGLVGIVRGFMYAGSKRVVASLWKVDDLATGELMSRYYSEMFNNGLSAAAALRRAQVSMWEQDEWSQPFYWAAFVLQGEWRSD